MPSQKSELAIRLIDFGASVDKDALGEGEAASQINYFFASVPRIKSQDRCKSCPLHLTLLTDVFSTIQSR